MGLSLNSGVAGINLTDQPPSYEDVIDPVHQNQNENNTEPRISPSDYYVPGSRSYSSISPDKRQNAIVTLAQGLTRNPNDLHQVITEQACLPARPYIRVVGRSTETRRQRGGEARRQPTVDFDFKLDLTRSLLPSGGSGEWSELHVVGDGNGEKAFRGGRWPSRNRMDTKPKGRVDLEQADQFLDPAAGTSTLMGWCERFCKDPAPVKSYAHNNTTTQLIGQVHLYSQTERVQHRSHALRPILVPTLCQLPWRHQDLDLHRQRIYNCLLATLDQSTAKPPIRLLGVYHPAVVDRGLAGDLVSRATVRGGAIGVVVLAGDHIAVGTTRGIRRGAR